MRSAVISSMPKREFPKVATFVRRCALPFVLRDSKRVDARYKPRDANHAMQTTQRHLLRKVNPD